MAKVFDIKKHIVSRGKVYNRITRRWEGDVADFDNTDAAPFVGPEGEVVARPPNMDDMTKVELVDVAREREIVGFSSMSKKELADALTSTGDVAEETGKDDGEEAG